MLINRNSIIFHCMNKNLSTFTLHSEKSTSKVSGVHRVEQCLVEIYIVSAAS